MSRVVSMSSDGYVYPKTITGMAPLATATCGHNRTLMYNLAVGYCRHDDGSECDNPWQSVRQILMDGCTCPPDATDEEIIAMDGHWPDCPRRAMIADLIGEQVGEHEHG